MKTRSKATQFINYRLHTDYEPYEVIEMSANGKTAKVRRMICERINKEDDEHSPAGFCCHTSHPKGQLWSYESNEDSPLWTMTLRNNGGWQFRGQKTVYTGGSKGNLADEPFKYYDYNF